MSDHPSFLPPSSDEGDPGPAAAQAGAGEAPLRLVSDDPSQSGRQVEMEPPYDTEIESALLGEMLLENVIVEELQTFLETHHFWSKGHRTLYDAICRMVRRGSEASPRTLAMYLSSDEDLKELGGIDYLNSLAAAALHVSQWRTYAEQVRDLYVRRRLLYMARDILRKTYEADPDLDAMQRIESIEHELYKLTEDGGDPTGTVPFPKALDAALKQAEAAYKADGGVSGLPSRLTDLDGLLGGFQKSDLLVLAARPGMGKTALATTIATNVAMPHRVPLAQDEKRIVLFFSLEMSAEQLALRIAAERAKKSAHNIRRGTLSPDDFQDVLMAAREIESMPLHIDDTPAMTVAQMRARARRLLRREGHLDLIVVDYIQLMQGDSDGGGRRIENRVQEVSQITRGLKMVAKEMNVPVLALSQLSRTVETRQDKRPILPDLRESGSIEQDADVVMFLYREEYYLARAEPGEQNTIEHDQWREEMRRLGSLAEIIVAKQRQGPLGRINVNYINEFTHFSNLESAHQPDIY